MLWVTKDSIAGNKIRYISQRDRYSCGATVIINYWKYRGIKVTASDKKFLNKIFESKREKGTYLSFIESIMNCRFHKISWGRFKNHLLHKAAIIINYEHHYFFIPSFLKTKKRLQVLAINYCNGETYHILTVNEMKKILKSSRVILCR